MSTEAATRASTLPPFLRTLYPPAVPGGIVLRLSRKTVEGHLREIVESSPVSTPGQAMRSMRRTAGAYGVLMTSRSRLSVRIWADDVEELYAALSALSNGRTYQRSWTLRNGHVLTLAVVPVGTADVPAPAVEAGPSSLHGEAPTR
ncbi:hypothetical protein ACFVXQ_05420 [Kitasatospora sp. NPDC058263]